LARQPRAKVEARDLAEEIVRRAMAGSADGQSLPYVVRLSDPPTIQEQLLLAACRLMKRPIAIMPQVCATMREWVERYAKR